MVTYGRGRGVVVTTGMKTEVGKIANMLQETVDTETPMSRRLEQLGKVLGTAALDNLCHYLYCRSTLRQLSHEHVHDSSQPCRCCHS